MSKQDDLQTVLHHIAHISHAYRGQVQVLENLRYQDESGFLACIDVPDNQITNLDPINATRPLLTSIRQRVLNTHPDIVIEAVDAQRYPAPNNSWLHKLFIRVRQGE
jgi:hypothetical protein